MKYCTYCGHPNQDNAAFCGKCGRSFEHVQMEAEEKGNGASSWVDQINDYVGNDRPADLNWKMLFTDVMKKHTKEEAEDIFICGTRTTTPALQDVSRGWPRPWLYSRVFFMFAMAFALLYVCCSMFGIATTAAAAETPKCSSRALTSSLSSRTVIFSTKAMISS